MDVQSARTARLEVTYVDIEACADALDLEESRHPRFSAPDSERIESLARDSERQRAWRVTRIAARLAIERVGGAQAGRGEIRIGSGGRPCIEDAPHFSISHTDGAALIAVAGQPVGVDIERLRPRAVSLARERRIIAAAHRFSSERDDAGQGLAFLDAWVRLEAIAKMRGTGIGPLLEDAGVGGSSRALEALPVADLQVRGLDVGTLFVAAIAARDLPQRISVMRFPADAEGIGAFLTAHSEIW